MQPVTRADRDPGPGPAGRIRRKFLWGLQTNTACQSQATVSSPTPPLQGHTDPLCQGLREPQGKDTASPRAVCPTVKNTSELPFQLQGQAAVQATQGEAGSPTAKASQPASRPASPITTGSPGKEGLMGNQSALADSSGSKVQSQSEPPQRNCKSQGSI